MEEMLGNVAGARQIFERWMQWEPDHHGWMAYIKARGMLEGASGCRRVVVLGGVGSGEPDRVRAGWLMYGDARPAGSLLCYFAILAPTAGRLYCRL
jgi:hypothetical protein